MNEVWYSREWDNAPMPHAIFFMKDGHAIHGSNAVKTLGKPVSHGCVRISPQNAVKLYALVAKNGLQNTQVVLSGLTPGGEWNDDSPANTVQSEAEAEIEITKKLLESNEPNNSGTTAAKRRQPRPTDSTVPLPTPNTGTAPQQ